MTTTVCGAFSEAAAATATASPAHSFVGVAVSVLSFWFSFNVAYAALDTLLDDPPGEIMWESIYPTPLPT